MGHAHDDGGAALERVGDNAVDIGEVTAFVVTGLFREFSDSSVPALTFGYSGTRGRVGAGG